jgi:PAS domain S-box-containing protein
VAEALGRTAAELFPPEVAAFIAEYDRELVETGRPSVYEQRLTAEAAADGPYAWSLVIRFPIRDERGRIAQIGGFDVDIGHRKAMERALQASEQRFRALTENHPVPIAVAVADDEGRMLYASPPLAELMGVRLEELVGGSVRRFYADPDVRPRLVAKLRRDGVLRGEEVRMRRGDGSEFWAAFTSKLIAFEGVEAMVTGITDLTELKRAEAEIERQRELLHQNEKMTALGSLLAGVAHELNNPLSVVVAQSAMLRDSAADDLTRERAAKVQAAAERCARIVRTFLAMARSKPQERGPVRLDGLIEAVLDIVAYGLRSGDVEVTLAFEPDLPAVWGDGDQLGQVLMNLIVNAQQALQAVPPPRRLRIATRREGDDAVAIEIADNGPGVEPENARRIFEPFFTTKPVGVGTGLGLSVCHGIVTAHGGEITVDSRPREGATFTVRLPLSGGADAGARPAAAAASPEDSPRPAAALDDDDGARPRGAGTILVIDDEPEIGELLAEFLERDGHRVELACSGREALGRLAGRGDEVDLIISDLRMPDMDGPALFRELANTRPELLPRIVFLTGDTLAADIQWFLAETGVPVIEKPFDPRGVSERVRRWFGGGGAGPF